MNHESNSDNLKWWAMTFYFLRTSYHLHDPHPFENISRKTFKYGTLDIEQVELLYPTNCAKLLEPIIFLHGGGWRLGHKEWYSEFLTPFVKCGHPVFNLDYRLAPENPFPEGIISALTAILFVKNFKFETYPIDNNNIMMMGDSAGGNIALMASILVMNRQLIEFITKTSDLTNQDYPNIVKYIGLYPPLERDVEQATFLARFAGKKMKNYAGRTAVDRELTADNSFMPSDLKFDNFPESLLLGGTGDWLYRSTLGGYECLKKKNAEKVKMINYPGEGHGIWNRWWRAAAKKLVKDITEFINTDQKKVEITTI